jgi:acetoacetate decarboxylase
MPVTDPPFDRPPYYYRGIEVMGFAYETDDDAAAAIVPEGLTIAHAPAIAQLIFTNLHLSAGVPPRSPESRSHAGSRHRGPPRFPRVLPRLLRRC